MPAFVQRLVASGLLSLLAGVFMTAAAQEATPAQPLADGRVPEKQEMAEKQEMKEYTNLNLSPAFTNQRSFLSDAFADFVTDQKELWSSPARLRFSDSEWLVPVAGLTAAFFVTDAQYSRHLSNDPHTLSRYSKLSTAGVAGLAGGAGAMWVWSHRNHNSHWQETGYLATEAAVNSLALTEGMKYSFGRARPFEGAGGGGFFQGGTSFPSEHAAAAWSIASVVAHEYPGPLTKALAYGAAALVSFSRVRAKDHFPSDVLVGALIGQLAGYQVYLRHHDPELGGEAWRSIRQVLRDGSGSPGNQGSPYVPLDSWIYPALDRLAALGFIDSAFEGMRPWTRQECIRLWTEAQEKLAGSAVEDQQAANLVEILGREFTRVAGSQEDNGAPVVRLESVYTRTEYISGMPLLDGFHFAQTQINDFGRPYGEGWNSASGFSFYTTVGRWSGYVRGELQTAPRIPALPLAARQFASNIDGLTVFAPSTAAPALQQFRVLEAYVGLTWSNWEFSFGRQSLLWGPGDGGELMFSDNAAPINMFRVNRVSPLNIPQVSRFLGPMRIELFLGQLTGHHFVGGDDGIIGTFSEPLARQPFIQGQRFSFKPTRNFEFGFSHTTVMAGPGVPLTFGTLKDGLLNQGQNLQGRMDLNGDGRSGLDWSYRLPRMRKWATFYGDAFNDDQPSPIAYWDRAAIRGGLYFSHLPKLPKLDLRVEGVYTDVPAGGAIGHGFFYFNGQYRNGYTNNGTLLGSWIGRDGQGAQAWTNYWISPRTRFQLNFRHQKVSQQFVPGGGTLTDFGGRTDFTLSNNTAVNVTVQRERWLFPIIQPGIAHNVSASVGITFSPQNLLRRAVSDGSADEDRSQP